MPFGFNNTPVYFNDIIIPCKRILKDKLMYRYSKIIMRNYMEKEVKNEKGLLMQLKK